MIDTGHGVILRQLTPDDAEMQSRAVRANKDHISQFGNQTAEGFLSIPQAARRLEQEASIGQYRFGVFLPEAPHNMVGNVQFGISSRQPELADHGGYWIAKDVVKQGVGTAALATAVDYAFGELGVEGMNARVRHGNIASARVLDNNDFVLSALEYEHKGETDYWQFFKYKNPPKAAQHMLDHPIEFTDVYEDAAQARSFHKIDLNGVAPRFQLPGITYLAAAEGEAFVIVEETSDMTRFVDRAVDFDPVFVERGIHRLGSPDQEALIAPKASIQLIGGAVLLMESLPQTTTEQIAQLNPGL